MKTQGLEIRRQLVHLLLGVGIASGVWILKPIYGNYILIPLLVAVALMLILPKTGMELWIHNHLMKHFERPEHKEKFPYRGAATYGIGIAPAIYLLDLPIACAIIVILSVGDSVSNLIGRKFGKHKVGHKSVEGFLGFVFFSWIASLLFLWNQPATAFNLSLVGGVLELSNTYHNHAIVDDNLLVPLGLTVFAFLLFWIL